MVLYHRHLTTASEVAACGGDCIDEIQTVEQVVSKAAPTSLRNGAGTSHIPVLTHLKLHKDRKGRVWPGIIYCRTI
jgi:hypothetical protein